MGFTDVRTDFSGAFLGQIREDQTGAGCITALNKDDQAVDLWSLTVSSTGPTSVVYTDPNGNAETNTIAASATAAALKSAIEAHADQTITEDYELTVISTYVLGAYGKRPGSNGTFTESSNLAVAHTTTGSLGSDLPMGRAVVKSGSGSMPGAGVAPKIKAMDSLTAVQVMTDTMTGTVNTGDVLETEIDIPAVGITVGPVRTIYTASESATLDAHASAVNTAIDAALGMTDGASITAARSGSTITYTGDEKGLVFRVRSGVVNTASGSGVLTTTFTTPSTDPCGNIAYDLGAALAGILPRSARMVEDTSSPPVIVLKKGSEGPVFRGPGVIQVAVVGGTPARGGRVYVGTSASTAGKLTATPTDGYVPVSLDQMRWDGAASSGYAPLRILRPLC